MAMFVAEVTVIGHLPDNCLAYVKCVATQNVSILTDLMPGMLLAWSVSNKAYFYLATWTSQTSLYMHPH